MTIETHRFVAKAIFRACAASSATVAGPSDGNVFQQPFGWRLYGVLTKSWYDSAGCPRTRDLEPLLFVEPQMHTDIPESHAIGPPL